MQHIGTRILETDRLILRRFKVSDYESMYKNWANDDEVTRFLTWPTHKNSDVSKIVLDDWISKYDNLDFYQWAIVPKDSGDMVIGSIGAVQVDDNIKLVHIGYCIGRKWWNQGFTSEALKRLIEFFIKEVGVNRVESRHDINNPNSGKVMKKCGMQYEGTMRQADKNNQGICDYSLYSILAEDFFK